MTDGQERGWTLVLFLVVVGAAASAAFPDALTSPFRVVQDDGRHFVAWLRALADPSLFAGDPIAAYFTALTPQTYRWLFLPGVRLGIDIQFWHLFVVTPLGVAAFLWAAHAFLRLLTDDPAARVLMLVCLALSLSADMPLGLPRSFREAIVLGALVLFLRRHALWLTVLMAIGANLYPTAVMVAGIAMALTVAARAAVARRIDPADIRLLALGAAGAVAGLSLFLSGVEESGRTITLAEARTLPIFGPGGRTAFFGTSDLMVMLCDGRGGLLPLCTRGPGGVPLALTVLWLGAGALAIQRLQPGQRSPAHVALGALLVAGTLLALIAWTVLFKAHLPSRYRIVSVDLAIWIGSAAMVAVAAGWLARHLGRWVFGAVTGLILLAMGFDRPAARQLRHDPAPAISNYLRSTPKDTLVAGLPAYIEGVPAFAARPVWVAPELTVPYKAEYLALMEARADTLMRLLDGPVDADWQTTLNRSGIDYMIIESDRLQAKVGPRGLGRWPGTFVAAARILGSGEAMPPTVFEEYPAVTKACRMARSGNLALIDLHCFAAAAP